MIKKIHFQDVNFGYENEQLVFENLTGDLPMNSIVSVGGDASCGKSTFLKLLIGLDVPLSGQIMVDSLDVSDSSFEDLLPYRLKVGYSFDLGGLLNNKSIRENLKLPLIYHNRLNEQEMIQRVEEFLGLFGLIEFAHLRPSEVSGGIRKSTCLARAFIMEPEMVLLDEPSTGLSAALRLRLKDLILNRMERGSLKHVFMASEDREFLSGFHRQKLKLHRDGFELELQ